MPIAMRALLMHSYYDETGLRVRDQGERYEIHDALGMTAEHLSARLERMGWAVRDEDPVGAGGGRPRKKATA